MIIDYKKILSNRKRREKIRHLYQLVLWWENEKKQGEVVI